MALLCALVFMLVAKSWHLLGQLVGQPSSFADSMMSESAQRFRDESQSLSRKQSTYLGGAVVFVVMYVAASSFQGPQIYAGYPVWQLYILFSALGAGALFALYRLVRTFLLYREVRFLCDANIAIGHALHRIAVDCGRTYHDVPTASGIIDHVLVGKRGVYAIHVLAKRHLRRGQVRLDHNELLFSNSDNPVSIVATAAAGKRLAKELGEITGRNIRVRSVLAVPGWDISEQLSHEHLLVNERTLPMVRGWNDQSDYLLDEEISAIQSNLTARCIRRKSRRLQNTGRS
ncbi:MAG TPA: hypothetical protein PKK10_03635 [Woeseiaceae bacterium]|nr:hypothetical protein [Woeseiaceae bacterium]